MASTFYLYQNNMMYDVELPLLESVGGSFQVYYHYSNGIETLYAPVLESIGGSLYRASLASGTEETGTPALAGMGSVQQGYLELSNVKVVEEMVNLIKAQRAYEINSKAIQAADEMMSMSNRLRG